MKLQLFTLLCLCSGGLLFGDEAAPASSQPIDVQIAELKEQRKVCKLQAELASRNADRLMTQDWLSYKREIQRQAVMEERIGQIDEEIKELEKKKQNQK
jgi:hypothetical protein